MRNRRLAHDNAAISAVRNDRLTAIRDVSFAQSAAVQPTIAVLQKRTFAWHFGLTFSRSCQPRSVGPPAVSASDERQLRFPELRAFQPPHRLCPEIWTSSFLPTIGSTSAASQRANRPLQSRQLKWLHASCFSLPIDLHNSIPARQSRACPGVLPALEVDQDHVYAPGPVGPPRADIAELNIGRRRGRP